MTTAPNRRRPRSPRLRWAPVALAPLAALNGCETTSPPPGPRAGELPPSLAVPEPIRMQRAQRHALDAFRSDRPDRAIRDYERSIDEFAGLPAPHNNLGVIFLEEGRPLEAAERFVTAAQLAPDDPRPVYNHALLWDQRHYYADALDLYLEALDRDANYLPALRGAVRAESFLNVESEETLARIRRALMLETDPDWARYFELRRLQVHGLLRERAEPGSETINSD